MKIAHFILSMSIGGGEKLVRTLSQCLHIPGYKNQVVCFDRITDYEEEFANADVPLTLIKRRQCLFDFSIIFPLVKLIRKEKIRLIHAHDLSALTYAVIVGRICGAKVIMTEHSRHYVDEALKRRLEKWLFVMGAHRLIEVSPELENASIFKDKIPSSHISVIENGVDIDLFQNAESLPIHAQLGIPKDTKLILTVGRLEVIKGQQHLIRAMADPVLINAPYHVVVVGDGSQKANLETLVSELNLNGKIHFLGARQDIPELMASCDLFVIPSESEGLPFVLLEAMSSGLLVLSSKVGRIPQIIGENERGVLMPPGNASILANVILEVFTDYNFFNLKAKDAVQYVAKYYSQKAMLEGYRNIYNNFLFHLSSL